MAACSAWAGGRRRGGSAEEPKLSRRYAIYAAPRDGAPLATLAARWLGRDVLTDATLEQPRIAGFTPERLAEITAAPRRYGFHATLKPPFVLAPGRSEAELRAAIKTFASARAPFSLPPLEVAAIGRFLALVCSAACPAIDALAADCVRAFDRFRARPSADQIARRRAGLTENQDRRLLKWGYPYVMDEFRFHMTLTGPLEENEERMRARRALEETFGPAAVAGFVVDSVCLFEQPETGTAFRLTGRFTFDGREA